MKAQQALGPAFIGAIGVVFGDIGTSPLYAFKESLGAAGFQPGDAATVLGLLSLIFWSLAIVVSVKYLAVIMRADNHGEGGILSLVALVQQRFGTAEPWARRAVALGVLGAALFYCDALITPAISVLSAVEGLEILESGFRARRHPGDARRHRGVVRDPAARHGESGPHVRPHHDSLVRRARGARRDGDRARAAGARGRESLVRAAAVRARIRASRW